MQVLRINPCKWSEDLQYKYNKPQKKRNITILNLRNADRNGNIPAGTKNIINREFEDDLKIGYH